MEHESYGVYKGLQKPLELMGLQGRYIVWAGVSFLISFLIFAVFFALLGLIEAIIVLALFLAASIALITYKQRIGLHDKKKMKGVHIITRLFK